MLQANGYPSLKEVQLLQMQSLCGNCRHLLWVKALNLLDTDFKQKALSQWRLIVLKINVWFGTHCAVLNTN